MKELERSISSLDQKFEKKIEDNAKKTPAIDLFERSQKDLEKRLSDEIRLKIDELAGKMEGILEEKVGGERMDRISAFENLQTQNFQREEILNNLTDGNLSVFFAF